jgi:hypothetical protein
VGGEVLDASLGVLRLAQVRSETVFGLGRGRRGAWRIGAL